MSQRDVCGKNNNEDKSLELKKRFVKVIFNDKEDLTKFLDLFGNNDEFIFNVSFND